VLAWYQALPRLLAAGEEGRFALIHNGQVGRHILDLLRFTYDGPARTFTLDWR
jgi:hypothetical protein